MDNLKKLNFTELEPSEMIQVQGGGVVGDAITAAGSILNSTGLIIRLNNLLGSLGLA